MPDHGDGLAAELAEVTAERDAMRVVLEPLPGRASLAIRQRNAAWSALERVTQERDEARQQIAEAEHSLTNVGLVHRLIRNRDEVTAERDRLAADHPGLLLANVQLRDERDEARAAIERVRALAEANRTKTWTGERADADTIWPSEILAALAGPGSPPATAESTAIPDLTDEERAAFLGGGEAP